MIKCSNNGPSEYVWTLWHAHVVICTFVPEFHSFPPTPSLETHKLLRNVQNSVKRASYTTATETGATVR